jgi:hypothetical protein
MLIVLYYTVFIFYNLSATGCNKMTVSSVKSMKGDI